MGKLVAALAHVPRHRDIVCAKRTRDRGIYPIVVDQLLSSYVNYTFIIYYVIGKAAEIEIGGVPVCCVLDTDA